MDNKEIKVLVVDDESDFTQPMSFWLKSKGYAVLVASDGQAAIDIVKKESPDIMFLDLNMPIMDGATTLKKIREFNSHLPVIIISAYVDDKRIIDVTSCGISGVFYKGADFQEGLTLLETTLRMHKKLKK